MQSERGWPVIEGDSKNAQIAFGKTHSRPQVSNDNPYSESQFKTLKYHRDFPGRFGSIQDARQFLNRFFSWYNEEHRHTGIGLMTPSSRHAGEDRSIYDAREKTLLQFYEVHPERFVRGKPKPPAIPTEAWINKPNREAQLA